MNNLALVAETQYDQLVREGREARERADNVQWVEGDLALRVELLKGADQPRDPETGEFLAEPDKALKRYAEDIEVNLSTLQKYRRTAGAWPVSERTPAGWAVHDTLSHLEDRFQLIHPEMTWREAKRIARVRSPKANYGHEPGWHELLGRVGDALADAEKHMGKVEDAITREPDQSICEKAGKYAKWAESLALRLRNLEAE